MLRVALGLLALVECRLYGRADGERQFEGCKSKSSRSHAWIVEAEAIHTEYHEQIDDG